MALTAVACAGSEREEQAQPIKVAAVWTDREQENFNLVLEKFNAANKTDVRYAPIDRENFGQEIRNSIEADSAPDVAILPQPGLLRDLAQAKSLIPIEPFAGQLVDRNYSHFWRDLGSYREELYGVWFKATNKSAIWYRANAFDDARARTWDDLLIAMDELRTGGTTPLALAAGDGWPLTDWFENVYLRTAGVEKYKGLACRRIAWTDSTVSEALTTLAQVLGRHDWLAGGLDGTLGLTFPRSVKQVFGDSPPAVLVSGGEFVAPHVPEDKVVGLDARAFPFPSIKGSKPSVVVGGDVVVLLRDTKVGRDLVRFLATAEAAEPWARAGGFISPNRELSPSVYPDDTTRGLALGLQGTEAVYDLSDQQPASFGATSDQGMWEIFQDFLREPSDVKGIATRLEDQARVAGGKC